MTSLIAASPSSDQDQQTVQTSNETPQRHKVSRQENKSQMVLARKLRNLQDLANAYDLNISDADDTALKTAKARRNVRRMASDVLASIDESNQFNLGSFVAQLNAYRGRSLTQAHMQTFYEELLEVMPSKWKEVFDEQQQHQSAQK